MINVEEYVRPQNLAEALEHLGDSGSVAIAGGTSLALSRNPAWTKVVDLSDIEEIDGITEDGDKLHLGAMVTMSDILRYPGNIPCSIVAAAKSVSSTPIRNMATVGGSMVRGVYWSDLIVALLALDAQVELATADETRVISSSELYATHPSKVLKQGEIITGVTVDMFKFRTHFIKLARTKVDYAIMSTCASIQISDGSIEQARITIGGAVNLATRLVEVEEMLAGQMPDGELFKAAGVKAGNVASFRSDFRVNSEYQKSVTEKLVARALENAFANCRCDEKGSAE
ncbi:MAG: FAD binding domain-containing protein [Deltaproteobacteria bacterium]|nr:FAD binding domain-containing protein [Deltaproteobacteria bacterium]